MLKRTWAAIASRPWLRRHAGRWRAALAGLLTRLRQDLSETVARVVRDAVHDGFQRLAGHDATPAAFAARSTFAAPGPSDPDDTWADEPWDAWGPPDAADEAVAEERREANDRPPEAQTPFASRWTKAVAAGLRAAACVLDRAPPVLAAIAAVLAVCASTLGPANAAAALCLALVSLVDGLAGLTAALH